MDFAFEKYRQMTEDKPAGTRGIGEHLLLGMLKTTHGRNILKEKVNANIQVNSSAMSSPLDSASPGLSSDRSTSPSLHEASSDAGSESHLPRDGPSLFGSEPPQTALSLHALRGQSTIGRLSQRGTRRKHCLSICCTVCWCVHLLQHTCPMCMAYTHMHTLTQTQTCRSRK